MNDDLQALGEEYWEWKLDTSPITAHLLGDHRHDHRFDDASREIEDQHIAALRGFADRAEAIDPSTLTADEQISREVLIFEAATAADDMETRHVEIEVNHEIGFHSILPVLVTQFPVVDPEHADAMVAKYGEIGRFIDQSTDRIREGHSAGRTPPRLMVERTKTQIEDYLRSSIEDDPLLNTQTPEAFDTTLLRDYKVQLADAIRHSIRPALQRQAEFLGDLVHHGRPDERAGLGWLHEGEHAYERAVRRHTSLDMTADEIHQIGLDTIAALAAEYEEMGAVALGTADLEEIFSRLRDDPALHFSSGGDIKNASEQALAKAKGEMGAWFGRLPKADCLVAETPSGPTAFYQRPAPDGSRPGTFYINTASPQRWGTFEIEAMTYHEGIPGHHLQLAISGELEGIPEFRKHARITAFAEGWGLYTERLADEMGLYSSPLDRIGMLSADSMRAARLVVDTGIHAKGWSRQKAIDYVRDNSPISVATIESEIDRYIGMPGQALAYMLGRQEIQRIRADAETKLGDRFDIKGFHDVVLGSGLVPLPTLARMVSDWVDSLLDAQT